MINDNKNSLSVNIYNTEEAIQLISSLHNQNKLLINIDFVYLGRLPDAIVHCDKIIVLKNIVNSNDKEIVVALVTNVLFDRTYYILTTDIGEYKVNKEDMVLVFDEETIK